MCLKILLYLGIAFIMQSQLYYDLIIIIMILSDLKPIEILSGDNNGIILHFCNLSHKSTHFIMSSAMGVLCPTSQVCQGEHRDAKSELELVAFQHTSPGTSVLGPCSV
jgi:hypothetical protein